MIRVSPSGQPFRAEPEDSMRPLVRLTPDRERRGGGRLSPGQPLRGFREEGRGCPSRPGSSLRFGRDDKVGLQQPPVDHRNGPTVVSSGTSSSGRPPSLSSSSGPRSGTGGPGGAEGDLFTHDVSPARVRKASRSRAPLGPGLRRDDDN